jgi:hypothetical protein
MANSQRSGITIRPISEKRLATELDTSTGISYNGTTHTVPEEVNGEVHYKRFYAAPGTPLSDARRAEFVKHEKTILELLPEGERQKAREQIAEWRANLAPTNSRPKGEI